MILVALQLISCTATNISCGVTGISCSATDISSPSTHLFWLLALLFDNCLKMILFLF